MAEQVELTSTPLSFDLSWEEDVARGSAAEATRGHLLLRLGSLVVWGKDGEGFPWTWIEMLEYLGRHWSYLVFEEVDPLGLGCLPRDLRPLAEHDWQSISEPLRDHQEELLWSFEQSHNLAAAVEGAWLQDLWILRQGRCYVLTSDSIKVVAPVGSVLEALESLGNQIADRVATIDDARATAARRAWAGRDRNLDNELLSIATSLSISTLDEVTQGGELRDFWEAGQSISGSELVALARSSGALLPPRELRSLLERVRGLPRRAIAGGLPELESEALALPLSNVPFEDGYTAARWLRERLELGIERVDPDALLSDWGVELVEIEISSEHLDAISVWGPRHGPAVLVNRGGRHAQAEHGRRSTLAHEVCHLLLDRRGALPLGDAVGGRVPEHVEVRARAFAAELLAPREIVGASFAGDRVDAPAVVGRLVEQYRASPEIIAWQARNSRHPLSEPTMIYLRTLVSRPHLFIG